MPMRMAMVTKLYVARPRLGLPTHSATLCFSKCKWHIPLCSVHRNCGLPKIEESVQILNGVMKLDKGP